MSTSITTAFVNAYEAKVHEVFQRQGSYLKDAVRVKDNVIGSTAVFNRVGTGVATTKARHGTITPMNQVHAAPSTTLADFYAGDWIDKLDEAKININERDVIASGGAMALGRKVDDQITTVLDTTTQGTVTYDTTETFVTERADTLLWVETLWANDVPNDGRVFAAVSPRQSSQFMTLQEFSRAEWVGTDGQTFRTGPAVGRAKWKDWLGVKWKMQTGLPGAGTATSKGFMWHATAVGYAIAQAAGNVAGNGNVAADITWHGDRAAHFVNHLMSGNAVMIDDTGVIEANYDDTAAIVEA